jgi:hypothetical protein
MSYETGCWLFVAAQHPNGGQHMMHYSSPKLREEGLLETNILVNKFNHLMGMMVSARRTNAMQLQRDRDEAVAAKEVADAEVEELRASILITQSEKQLMQALLDKYKSLYTLPQDANEDE